MSERAPHIYPRSSRAAQDPGRAEHILRATYRLISRQGITRVSMQDIADAADVSKALLSYYFKSKDNLILETMRWVQLYVIDRMKTQLEAADPSDKLDVLIDLVFSQPTARRGFYLTYLELAERAARFEEFQQLSRDFREILEGLYAEVIQPGVEVGAYEVDDVRDAALLLRALIDGLHFIWLQESVPEDLVGRYKEVCRDAMAAYLSPGSSGKTLASLRRRVEEDGSDGTETDSGVFRQGGK